MGIDLKNEDKLNAVLREVYDSAEPPDSWSALRSRIDGLIERGLANAGTRHKPFGKTVVFRLAVCAAAACLVVSLSLLSYVAGLKQGRSGYHTSQLNALDNHLFTEAKLGQLCEAFSQIRALFPDELPWIVIGEGDHVQIGVNGRGAEVDTGRVVVIRLAVNFEGQGAGRQYFDVVTFANQPADLLLPLVSEAGVHVGLIPRLSAEGTIDVEIDARMDGDSRAQNTGRIASDAFTSLIRMRADGGWLSIKGTAWTISGT